MKGVPQGRYMKEFREEAVKLVTEENISLPEAAPSALSLPPATLATWVKAYKAGRLGEVGRVQRPLTEIEMELARAKKVAPALGLLVFGLIILEFLIFGPRGLAHRWEVFKASYRLNPFSY